MRCLKFWPLAILLHLASAVLASAQTYSEADKQMAGEAAQLYKQKYWDCLTSEIVKMASTDITATDFKLYLAGSCGKEKQDFRVPFVDYLAMRFPEKVTKELFESFDYVVQLAIDDSVSGLIGLRSQQ